MKEFGKDHPIELRDKDGKIVSVVKVGDLVDGLGRPCHKFRVRAGG